MLAGNGSWEGGFLEISKSFHGVVQETHSPKLTTLDWFLFQWNPREKFWLKRKEEEEKEPRRRRKYWF